MRKAMTPLLTLVVASAMLALPRMAIGQDCQNPIIEYHSCYAPSSGPNCGDLGKRTEIVFLCPDGTRTYVLWACCGLHLESSIRALPQPLGAVL